MGHTAFTASEASSKGLYSRPVLTGLLLLKEGPMHICRHTGLTNSKHLCAGGLWTLISKADCNLTTKSSENKFYTCERCHLVCLRDWRLFMHQVGTALGVTKLVFFKPLPRIGWSQEKGPRLAGKRTARPLMPTSPLVSLLEAPTVWERGKGKACLVPALMM